MSRRVAAAIGPAALSAPQVARRRDVGSPPAARASLSSHTPRLPDGGVGTARATVGGSTAGDAPPRTFEPRRAVVRNPVRRPILRHPKQRMTARSTMRHPSQCGRTVDPLPVRARSATRAGIRLALAALALAVAAPTVIAQIPAPADVFGFEPGADYQLADYTQLAAYYRRLAAASDRVQLQEIGTSTRGRPMFVLFISSPENLARLEHWRSISERLSRARDVTDEQARQLAREGRTILWIDAGLHSSEVAHSQFAPLLAHHMATDDSDETRRFRDDVILLLMPGMNPDGHEIVVDWYRRQRDTPFETTATPDVYHEYIGHDINRDWFMITQEETRHVSRVLYHEWYPQIIFNHHQTAPFPARIFIPPFADPVNPHIAPLVVRGVNMVGEHMAKRIEEEGMPGVVSRMSFTMWWNGGMRTVPYFKNMIGLLSEVGHASATPQFHDPENLPEYFGTGSHRISAREPSVYYTNPWQGGWARLGDAVQYHFVSSLGALDIASRLREDWLFNIYRMGRDAIAAGQSGGPYAYVIPMDETQWDAGEAVNLVNTLRRGGVEVQRATAAFMVNGTRYAAGTYVIPAAQAWRAYVVDLMEPQQHPHMEQYPGGPPQAPYGGLSGWTLPLQMGVRSVRVEQPFTAQLAGVDEAPPPVARAVPAARFGWLLSTRRNEAATAVNRLLAQGERVGRAGVPFQANGRAWDAGTFVVHAGAQTRDRVEALARELGLDFVAANAAPAASLAALRQPRLGLYRSWTANMDEGWTRFVLDQHDFAVETLRDADMRGDLSRFDAIILPDQAPNSILRGHTEDRMPPGFTGGIGDDGVAALRAFVSRGGRVIAFDRAADFAIEHLGLPLQNPVAAVGRDELYIPGSLLRMHVDATHPVAYGMQREGVAFFQESRGFEATDASDAAVEVVARYGARDLLLSGWEIGGQQHVAGLSAVVRAPSGQGDVVLIGFRPQFRAWPAGTYKLIFNSIFGAAADAP
jgi:hypothetical protein